MLPPASRRWFAPLAAAAVLTLGPLPLAAQVKPAANALDEAIAVERYMSPPEAVAHLMTAPSDYNSDNQNAGTAPINSERLFHALQGLGKDVSLYMYPYADHGPIAHETVLKQRARWVAWLDKYVNGAGDEKPVAMEDE